MSMARMIVGGVDTHADQRVVAVIDWYGGVLGIESFPADHVGFEALLGWFTSCGEIDRVGVEVIGSWGVGPPYVSVCHPGHRAVFPWLRKSGGQSTLPAGWNARVFRVGYSCQARPTSKCTTSMTLKLAARSKSKARECFIPTPRSSDSRRWHCPRGLLTALCRASRCDSRHRTGRPLHRAENEPSTRSDTYGSVLMDAV